MGIIQGWRRAVARIWRASSRGTDAGEWQPVVRLGMFVPLQMRKRGSDGRWVYREPTEAEIREYIEGEAW